MKIEAPSENRIMVELSRDDMSELDITYEEMDYSNIETRRVLWTLLDEARRALGFDIDPSGKMLIEAVPKSHGGCILCFTVLGSGTDGSQKLLMKYGYSYSVYEFESIDNLLDLTRQVNPLHMENTDSELYKNEGKYRLLIRTDGDSSNLYPIMCEYSNLISTDSISAAYTREHWEAVPFTEG